MEWIIVVLILVLFGIDFFKIDDYIKEYMSSKILNQMGYLIRENSIWVSCNAMHYICNTDNHESHQITYVKIIDCCKNNPKNMYVTYMDIDSMNKNTCSVQDFLKKYKFHHF